MQKILLSSLLAFSLSAGSASFSQDTTTTEAPTPDAAPVTAEDQTFPVAQNDEKIGTDFIKEEHDKWKILCTVVEEGENPNCRLFQILEDDNGGAVAELSIIALSDKAQAEAGVNFVSPLGTLLTSQLSVRIDSGQARRYPFGWCETKGCVVRFGLTSSELNNLKKGNNAVFTIAAAAAPKTPLALTVSLKGYTAAWNALKELRVADDTPAAE